MIKLQLYNMKYPNSLQNQAYNLSPTLQHGFASQNTCSKAVTEILRILISEIDFLILH